MTLYSRVRAACNAVATQVRNTLRTAVTSLVQCTSRIRSAVTAPLATRRPAVWAARLDGPRAAAVTLGGLMTVAVGPSALWVISGVLLAAALIACLAWPTGTEERGADDSGRMPAEDGRRRVPPSARPQRRACASPAACQA